LRDEGEDFVAFGEAADDLFVADLVEEGVAAAGRFVAGLMEGRLAELDHVVFLRFGIGAEEEQVAVGEEGEPVAGDAFLDLLGISR
jgi:hypothetical protein